MNRFRMVWLCARKNFFNWKTTPRIWVLAFTILVFGFWDYGAMSGYAREVYGGMTSWVLPFAWSDALRVMVFDCITIAFFSNAPFSDSYSPFLIIRAGRRNWIVGQVLYIFLASIVYVFFYLVVSVLGMLPNFNLANEWTMAERAMAAGEIYNASYSITLNVSDTIVEYLLPLQATGIKMLLMWGVAVFTGFLIMMFNMISRGTAGIAVAGVLTFLGYFWSFFGTMWLGERALWLSPMSWCTMHGVNLIRDDGLLPPLSYVVPVLIGTGLAMAVISVWFYSKQDIHIVKEEF